ncbi:GGDEF domain-containing protein [Gallaecimonas xiamenensis]|nr:GGDEF domain-containing protein [Gallaecimonas xiamenensis]
MSAEQSTLFLVLILIAAIAAVAWLSMALPMKVAPRASLRFALANSLLVAGVQMMFWRGPDLSWLASDFLNIAALVLIRSGTQYLMKIRVTRLEHCLVLLVYGVAIGAIGAEEEDHRWLGVAFSLAAAYIFSRLLFESLLAIRHWFGLSVSFWLNWPFALVALFMLFRAIVLVFHDIPDQDVGRNIGAEVAWLYLSLWLLINISMVGCALGRLILKIRLLADRDPLTGLLNRRVFQDRQQQLDQDKQSHYSLVLVDLDDFKCINDRFGHVLGDQALRHCAQLLQQGLGREDLLARLGGEEFVILLPGHSKQQASALASRLIATLGQSPLHSEQGQVQISASFGVADNSQARGDNLYRLADLALYQAKQGGKCQVVAYGT